MASYDQLEADDKLKDEVQQEQQDKPQGSDEQKPGAADAVKDRNEQQTNALLQPAAPAAEPAKDPGANVSLQKAVLQFRAASSHARSEIKRVQGELSGEDADAGEQLAHLPKQLQHHEDHLLEALDEAKTNEAAKGKVFAIVGELLSFVSSDPAMQALADGPITTDGPSRLIHALHALDSALHA